MATSASYRKLTKIPPEDFEASYVASHLVNEALDASLDSFEAYIMALEARLDAFEQRLKSTLDQVAPVMVSRNRPKVRKAQA